MKARIIVVTLLALVTGTAAASDWQLVNRSADGDAVSMDAASLTRHGNIVRSWTRAVYAEPKKVVGDNYLSDVVRMYFDCAERRMALKETTVFADREFKKVVFTGPSKDDALLEWHEVAPDSIAETMLEFACSRAPK